jgi:hypothetical protein
MLAVITNWRQTMPSQRRSAIALAAVAAACLIGTACGGAAAAGGRSTTPAGTAAPADWARQADAICRKALPDDSHAMVTHFDSAHIKRHGLAIVLAGSALDQLGPPRGADAGDYQHMLDLYRTSAVRHGLALRELRNGNDGNAVVEYSVGLGLADRADRLAVGFGASSCARFGIQG